MLNRRVVNEIRKSPADHRSVTFCSRESDRTLNMATEDTLAEALVTNDVAIVPRGRWSAAGVRRRVDATDPDSSRMRSYPA